MRIGIKLLVAAGVGGLTYLLTALGDQQPIWRAGVAVAVGAFTLVAQLLIEAAESARRLELARKANALSRAEISRLVTTGARAAAPAGATSPAAPATHPSAPAADPSGPVLPGADLPGAGAAREGFIDLDGLRADGVERDAGDPDWLLGLTDATRVGIDAITMASFGEGEFWDSDLGRRYLRRQREAIARNVRIRRLFLITERVPDPERIRALMAPHQSIGVETRAIRPDDFYFLRQIELEDFIVFDRKVSYEFHAARVLDDGMTPPIAGVALVVDPRLVEQRQERFEQLWSAAR
ncbi:hypothetical protein GCM10010172_74140 [Paractinoplanes ferrugineus]|uniref:DUF6879 domain-containing protein n=1 Tax=Paractinoplanes ferrugineus TaxID=113564 RepID=A0A919MGB0_9ACTN|nr:DUF6879 family protein [Actinoplanes ferrugineus]GIE11430.1 hypothetical protein Afe05nite_32700 [Actinoplanes ferrugineus]